MDTASSPDATTRQLLLEAIDLAVGNASGNGGPFGAVLVTADGRRFRRVNQVTADNDPTAHAEIMAIRAACREQGDFDLTGAAFYDYFTTPGPERCLPVCAVRLEERTAPFAAWAANADRIDY